MLNTLQTTCKIVFNIKHTPNICKSASFQIKKNQLLWSYLMSAKKNVIKMYWMMNIEDDSES